MALRGLGLDGAHDVHAVDDLSEGGEALAVRIAHAAEVEFRLIVNADEEIRNSAVSREPGHRDRAVAVVQSRFAGAFEG